METLLAKALYDNTAESPDELAFRKGDIVRVMDQNVAGSPGWWKCILYGRQGLAPANRLQLLPKILCAEKPKSANCQGGVDIPQNIYQIPSVPRMSTSPAYEQMDRIYKVPCAPLSTSKSPVPSLLKHGADGPEGNCKASAASILSNPKGDVYDVPSRGKRASLFTPSTMQPLTRNASLMPTIELERRFDTLGSVKHSPQSDTYVYAVPPPVSQDPSYDVPVSATGDAQQRLAGDCSTLPNPRKSEWIYDVPVSPEKPGYEQGYHGANKAAGANARPPHDAAPASLYDVPKPSSAPPPSPSPPSPPRLLPRAPVYDRPPGHRLSDDCVYAVPPHDQPPVQRRGGGDSHRGHVPLECRGDPGPTYDHPRGPFQRGRISLVAATLRGRPGSAESPLELEEEAAAADSQRSSTASSSSTSSCDSLALSSSSSPEPPLREVTLGQEEVGRRLLELQEALCGAVPLLMDFVSSHWRSREHLGKHLEEIRGAAEGVARSTTHFLNFAADVKGNARRLNDANLQARLHKQLSIVEDSGLILQQTVSALSLAGWPLDTLSQDPGQSQTPDQLDRFVMVARTVPEDVKRLVSILNANGKLLFKPAQREPDNAGVMAGQAAVRKCHDDGEHGDELVEDENDYVQLQTKKEFEKQQTKTQEKQSTKTTGGSVKPKEDQKRGSSEPQTTVVAPHQTSMPEHCRLYFGALQKAIGAFVSSLLDDQPPEKFISHGKLVIMVGQRLVDTLCREAHTGETSQSLLCKSNHLCALLKQLAVATKKAALHFPDQQALQEAQDFAKDLDQHAKHFRTSLDL